MPTPRLLVVNPNTSRAMTATIDAAAQAAAEAIGVQVDVVCPEHGPESIEGRFDEIVSAYWTLDCVLRVAERYAGFLVACYGPHPAIDALREALSQPTMGIMEASILYALPLAARFSIVTTSPRWQPLLEEGVRLLGVASRCASVRSSGLAVLDLDRLPAAQVRARLGEAARAAVEHDGAEVILLGCAGMAGLEETVRAAAGVPVVDAVRAGVTLVGALARAGGRTSPRNLYRPVEARPGLDLPPGLARVYRGELSEGSEVRTP
jgi:allantoin racemase